jgi:hypothetical protein
MKFQKEFALLKEAGRSALSMRKVMKFQVNKDSAFEIGINPMGHVSYAKHTKKGMVGQRKTITSCNLLPLDIHELLGYWKENVR